MSLNTLLHRKDPLIVEETKLKRAVDSGGYAPPHSCIHCRVLELPAIPPQLPMRKLIRRVSLTTNEVREHANDGCQFWAMIDTKIGLIYSGRQSGATGDTIDAEEARFAQDYMKYDENEAAVQLLDSAEEAGLQRLQRQLKKQGWYQKPDAAWDKPIKDPDFVGIATYFSDAEDQDDPICVEISLVLPSHRQSAAQAEALRLEEHTVPFLFLGFPGDFEETKSGSISAPINRYPSSPDSFVLYRHWLERCNLVHECGVSKLPYSMPPMVLDIRDTIGAHRVRLLKVDPGMRARYVTFAYLSAPVDRRTTLVQANLSVFHAGVEISQLDASIEDAVTVARNLGFDYLWAHTLCTIQDAEPTESLQATHAAEIFANSTLTIVNSRGASTHTGFLSERMPAGLEHPSQVFEVKAHTHKLAGAHHSAILVPSIIEDLDPLTLRAKAARDHSFARRQLHFTDAQTLWMCHGNKSNLRACDGWKQGQEYSSTEPVMLEG